MKFVQKTSHFALLAALLLAMPASYASPAVLTQPAPFKSALHRNLLVGTALAMILAHPVAVALEASKNVTSRDISKAPSARGYLSASWSAFAAPFKDLYVVFSPEETRDMKAFSARGKDFLHNHKAFSVCAAAFLVNVGVSGSLYGKYQFDLKKYTAQQEEIVARSFEASKEAVDVEAGLACEDLGHVTAPELALPSEALVELAETVKGSESLLKYFGGEEAVLSVRIACPAGSGLTVYNQALQAKITELRAATGTGLAPRPTDVHLLRLDSVVPVSVPAPRTAEVVPVLVDSISSIKYMDKIQSNEATLVAAGSDLGLLDRGMKYATMSAFGLPDQLLEWSCLTQSWVHSKLVINGQCVAKQAILLPQRPIVVSDVSEVSTGDECVIGSEADEDLICLPAPTPRRFGVSALAPAETLPVPVGLPSRLHLTRKTKKPQASAVCKYMNYTKGQKWPIPKKGSDLRYLVFAGRVDKWISGDKQWKTLGRDAAKTVRDQIEAGTLLSCDIS